MKKSLLVTLTILIVLPVITVTAERKIWMYSNDGKHIGMNVQELDSVSSIEPMGLTLSISEKKLSSAGGTFTLGIKTNEKWNASSSNPMAVKLSKTSGVGDDEITVTAVANQGQQRYTSTVIVSLQNGMYKSLLVTVYGKEECKLEIFPKAKKMFQDGGRFSFEIITEDKWDAYVNDNSKVILSAYKGEGNASIGVLVNPIDHNTPYLAEVFIKTEAGETKKLVINVTDKKNITSLTDLCSNAYSYLEWLHDYWGYWGLNTLTSDEACCPVRNPGNNWDDGGYWASLNTMSWDSYAINIENSFKCAYDGIYYTTYAIAQSNEIKEYLDEDYYAKYIAEVKVLRAYYYYILFDLCGRIPYIPEEEWSYDKINDEYRCMKEISLMDTNDSWNYIVQELEQYTKLVPINTSSTKELYYGRVTQGLGYALLARLYLNAESMGIANVTSPYKKCIEYCDSVINSKAYSIADNFFDNFLVYNEDSPENIFVIVENGNASFNYQYLGGYYMCNKLRLNLLTQHYSFQTLYNTLEKPLNGFAASTQFMSLYEQSDRRGPCPPNAGTDIDFQDKNTKFGWFLGPVRDKNTGIVMRDENGNDVVIVNSFDGGVNNASWNEGARCMKYETEIGSTRNKYMENDFVLFRYADVLYMKAEAMLRNGEDITPLLNDHEFRKIRIRAGVEPYNSLTLDEILDERGREFAWENIRRRDLIRFGKYTGNEYMWDSKTYMTEEYKKWFPIPRKFMEMHANDKIPWTQNEGYY